MNRHEKNLDSITKGMSELAASSRMPSSSGMADGLMNSMVATPKTLQETVPASATAGPLVCITEEDKPLCSNSKSCYQDAVELFETTNILVDGAVKEVAPVIPGVLDDLEITPELLAKADRAVADCDSEIIRFQPRQ